MSTPIRNVLECRLGLGRIALPTDAIDQLGEYEVGTTLPLRHRVSCAIGVWNDHPLLSISLAERDPVARRMTHGAVFTTTKRGLRCAFEIDEPIGLAQIASIGAPPTSLPWRRTATLADGRSLQLIDVATLLQEIAGLVAA